MRDLIEQLAHLGESRQDHGGHVKCVISIQPMFGHGSDDDEVYAFDLRKHPELKSKYPKGSTYAWISDLQAGYDKKKAVKLFYAASASSSKAKNVRALEKEVKDELWRQQMESDEVQSIAPDLHESSDSFNVKIEVGDLKHKPRDGAYWSYEAELTVTEGRTKRVGRVFNLTKGFGKIGIIEGIDVMDLTPLMRKMVEKLFREQAKKEHLT